MFTPSWHAGISNRESGAMKETLKERLSRGIVILGGGGQRGWFMSSILHDKAYTIELQKRQ